MRKLLLDWRARNGKFMVTLTRSRLLFVYVTISSALVGVITLAQYFRYNLFGTNLLLGWDSPQYVWMANEIVTKGPLHLITYGKYPHLYAQLLAFLGYLTGNVTIIERILPLVFCTLLIYANARITLRITKNTHVAGLAALLTAISVNTLRLYADLNRNLMVLSLSLISFLFISDFIDQKHINKKSLLSRTYLCIIALFVIVAGTQLETFIVLALTTILVGVISRNWKKLAALTLIPAILAVILLVGFPQLLLTYLYQMGLFPRELYLNEVLLWIGGSWVLIGFLAAGATYMSYLAIRQKNAVASTTLSWAIVIGLLAILTACARSAAYAERTLMILPVPVFLASAVFAFGSLLQDTFLEVGMSSPAKRHAIKLSLKHIAVVAAASALMIGSTAITSQHYDTFLIPYIPKTSYDKVFYACQFLEKNGLSKPMVVFYGEHSSWFMDLYSSYIGAEIGDHFSYQGDVSNLLKYYTPWFLGGNASAPALTQRPYPIVLITPYLYDKEIPYSVTPYHIGQGIYVVPPTATISSQISYGPEVGVVTESSTEEVRSEYLYADQYDPSIIVLRVTVRGYASYTFRDYPSDWVFLKLEQGGDLSFPENGPCRFSGAVAEEGNDPAESTQDWSTSQIGAINVDESSAKEGYADLRVEGVTDSWGNLGAEYNPVGTWDLTTHSFLAVWAKANMETTFSIGLNDAAGNTRTFWDLKPDGSSTTTQWTRFAINLSNYTSQSQSFDLSRVDSVDFYVYSNPGTHLSLCIDDPVIDTAPAPAGVVCKARVHHEDTITLYFWTRID
jgi:hypothetical protein